MTTFFEKYKIIKEIGSGSYGTVYKIQKNIPNEKFFASKFYDIKKIVQKKVDKNKKIDKKEYTKKTLESIKKEYTILKKLPKTKHFVRYYEMYEDVEYEGTSYVVTVMELVDGIDLSDYEKEFEDNVVPIEQSLNFITDFLKILKSLHTRNIVHHDIKPHNVMVRKNGQVVLIDFGLSCVAEFSSENSTNNLPIIMCNKRDKSGSASYMAPELFDPKIDRSSFTNKDYVDFFKANDIWSAGVMFYEMVMGYKPFRSKNPLDIQKIILKGKYDPLEGVDNNIKKIIESMLILDFKKRPRIATLLTKTKEKKENNDLLKKTGMRIAKDAIVVYKKYSEGKVSASEKNKLKCVANGAKKIAEKNNRKTIMKKDVEASIEIVECK